MVQVQSTILLKGHHDAVNVVKFFPQMDYMVATGSRDMTIKFWDIRKGSYLCSLNQHGDKADSVSSFSENGKCTFLKYI
jgi:WD40 repeat protein